MNYTINYVGDAPYAFNSPDYGETNLKIKILEKSESESFVKYALN